MNIDSDVWTLFLLTLNHRKFVPWLKSTRKSPLQAAKVIIFCKLSRRRRKLQARIRIATVHVWPQRIDLSFKECILPVRWYTACVAHYSTFFMTGWPASWTLDAWQEYSSCLSKDIDIDSDVLCHCVAQTRTITDKERSKPHFGRQVRVCVTRLGNRGVSG